jgi:hypothetical protein
MSFVFRNIIITDFDETNPNSAIPNWYSKGTTGQSGQSGAQGLTGSTGPEGPQGPQGYQGSTGAQGYQGYQGYQGIDGPQGYQGMEGPIGPIGFSIAGSYGVAGSNGLDATSIPGPTGETGPIGPQGPTGVPGMSREEIEQYIMNMFVGYTGCTGCTGCNDLEPGCTGCTGYYKLICEFHKIITSISVGATGAPGEKGATGTFMTEETIELLVRNIFLSDPSLPRERLVADLLELIKLELPGVAIIKGATGAMGPVGEKGSTGEAGLGETAIKEVIYTELAGSTGVQDIIHKYFEDHIYQFIGPVGPTGASGPAGPEGTMGSQGHQGFQGNLGPQGHQGLQGPQGNTGAQGFQGPQGHQGHQGLQGPQGNTGAQGFQGPQGITGAQGNTGAQGFQGPQGITGAEGITGAQGFQGPLGYQGDVGDPGEPGSQGPTGPIGTQGVTGPIGLIGPQGNTGFGAQGITGPQGYQGSQGEKGDFGGPQGPQGHQGPPGTGGNGSGSGETGAQGATGAQGPQGHQGILGAQGNTGSQGPMGVGSRGPVGITGPTGPEGPQGTQGAQGQQGPQGYQGYQGPQGPTGAEGVTGAQGNTGPQGPTGLKGATGKDGPTVEELTPVLRELITANNTDRLFYVNKQFYGNYNDKDIVYLPIESESSKILDLQESAIKNIKSYKFVNNINYRIIQSGVPSSTTDIAESQPTINTIEASVNSDSVNQAKIILNESEMSYYILVNKSNSLLYLPSGSSTTYKINLSGLTKFNDIHFDQQNNNFYAVFDTDINGSYSTFLSPTLRNVSTTNMVVYQYDVNNSQEYMQDVSKNGFSYHDHIIDGSGALHLVTKNTTQFKYIIYNKSLAPVIQNNVFAQTSISLDSVDLNDFRIFNIYPNFNIQIGLKNNLNDTTLYIGINDNISVTQIVSAYPYSNILHLQYMDTTKYYIYLKDSTDKLKMVIRDNSNNIYNHFDNRTIYFVDQYVKQNIYFIVGKENSNIILFVFMKGELLFEDTLGDLNTTFGLGDLYYKDNATNPTLISFIKIYSELIGIYNKEKDLIQISGDVPSYFTNNYNYKNVYFDNLTNRITSDRSKKWVGLKKPNNAFYIK